VRLLFDSAAKAAHIGLIRHTPIDCISSGGKLLADRDGTANGTKSPRIGTGDFDTIWPSLQRLGNRLVVTLRHIWDGREWIAIIGHLRELDVLASRTSAAMPETSSRFLWCYVDDERTVASPQTLPVDEVERLAKAVGAFVKDAQARREMSFGASTQKLWEEAYPDLISPRDDAAGIVTSRGDGHVIRLAMTFALLDASTTIDVPHLKAGFAVWDYCRLSAETLFGSAVPHAFSQRLLEELESGPLSLTELHGVLHNHTPAAKLTACLDELAQQGFVVAEVTGTAGRPLTMWRLADRAQGATAPASTS
jgi:hypothetical protein